jgi:hypothetical protein
MEILLADFSDKVGREDTLEPTIWNRNLHEISNDNQFRVLNFSPWKNPVVKSTIFPGSNIHKFTYIDKS